MSKQVTSISTEELKRRITDIFADKSEWPTHYDFVFGQPVRTKTKLKISFKYGGEYTSPDLSFPLLIQLGRLLGTDEINFDDYDVQGCQTCGYGGDHGHEIEITNPTKHVDTLLSLAGEWWSASAYYVDPHKPEDEQDDY